MSVKRMTRGAIALAWLAASCAEPSDTRNLATSVASKAPDEASAEAVRATLQRVRSQFVLRQDGARLRALREAEASSLLTSEDALPLERVRDSFVPRYDHTESVLDDVEVTLPASAAEPFRLRRTDTQLSVSARLLGAKALPGAVADGFVTYQGAGPHAGTILQKVTANGTEDYLTLEAPVPGDEVVYEVGLSDEVAGLRLVANTLEFLDSQGSPALRIAPPYLVTSAGEYVDASLEVTGCAVDRNGAPPWGRPTTATGSETCFVHVSWEGEKISYPALLDPAWMSAASMARNRTYHTATPLQYYGRVLVAGGWTGLAVSKTAEIYDPTSGTWAATNEMRSGALEAAATLLDDGRVLFVGGWTPAQGDLAGAQIFQPAEEGHGGGTWSDATPMAQARSKAFSTRLPSGEVLVAGGSSNEAGALASAAIYRPSANAWEPTGSTTETLSDPVGVALDDSRILMVGASGSGSLAQIYEIDSGTWSKAATPTGNHAGATITKLQSNQGVLIAGGAENPSIPQIYDPEKNTWTKTGATSQVRGGATATILGSGRVLLIGSSLVHARPTAELFNPTWGTWSPVANLDAGRWGHTATRLLNGRVLVVGGTSGSTQSNVQLFDPSPTATTVKEYRFPAGIDETIVSDRVTEIWAAVHRPSVLKTNVRYPVILFLHGNHETCRENIGPEIKEADFEEDGTCPTDYTELPSHRGYDYIASELAERGYIVVSINANRGFNDSRDPVRDDGDQYLILGRGRLILKHLELLSRWNHGEDTPQSLGVSLNGKLDLEQVGLMGHSRGGQAVRAAYQQYVDAGSRWQTAIVDRVDIRGIIEIAPTDYKLPRVMNALNTRWAVVFGLCDHDAGSSGTHAFDRMVNVINESTPSFKATYAVWGANHNFYNTEWKKSEDDLGCYSHAPMFGWNPGEPYSTGSAEQRQTGFYSVLSFFLANVGSAPDTRYNSIFDPRFAPVANVRVDRGYTPGSNSLYSRRLEDFTGVTEIDHQNVAVSYGVSMGPDFDSTFRGAYLKWGHASQATYFQSNWAASGSAGFNLSTSDSLDFRVALSQSQRSTTPVTFVVQLVDASDTLSSAVPVERYASLVGPPEHNGIMQTVRIPLTELRGVNLSAIRGIRFTFSGTSDRTIAIANIRSTRQAIDAATTGLHGAGDPAPTFHTFSPRTP